MKKECPLSNLKNRKSKTHKSDQQKKEKKRRHHPTMSTLWNFKKRGYTNCSSKKQDFMFFNLFLPQPSRSAT